MASGSDEVKSLLKDVTLNGVVVVSKKKLLWLLGWGQDREGAWRDLLVHWKAIGEKEDKLHGIEVYDKIVLSMPSGGTFEPVSNWAPAQGETVP